MDIEDINQMIRSQEELATKIKSLLTNMKKDSPTRKTQKYISERRSLLTQYIERVQENHNQLQEQEVLATHKYLTTDYYGGIFRLFEDAIQHLQNCEERLKTMHTMLYQPQDIMYDPDTDIPNPKLGVQKFRINQLQHKIETASQAITMNKPSWHLQSLLQSLQKQWDIIEQNHLELIMEDSTMKDEYFKSDIISTTQKLFETICEKLESKTNENHSSSSNPSRSTMKLPTITIPIFTGSYETWSSFHDLFEKIINNDSSLTNTEKMQYLKTNLRGEPEKLIQHLNVCESNYTTAWSLLKKRYQNDRIIVNKYIDKILDFPQIEKASAMKLKNMHDVINECVEGLRNINIDTQTWGPILSRIVTRKWDSETNSTFELSLDEPNKIQDFSKIMQHLEKRFKCLEYIQTTRQPNIQPSMQPNMQEKPSENHIMKYEKPHSKPTDNNTPCVYCYKPNHGIYYCQQFKALSVNDRINAIRSKKLCYNCMNHDISEKCNSKTCCHFCGKKHHSMIHIDNYTNLKTYKLGETNKPSTSKYTPPENKPPPVQKPHAHMSKMTSHSTRTTLLATALVETTTSNGTPQLLRVLCDQGSESSFCTEEVAQLLNHPRQRIQAEIQGLGDEKPKISNYAITTILKPRFPSEYKLPVSLIILPKLTNPLPSQDLPPLENHYQMNQLIADPTFHKKGPIDVILGAQEYSQILLEGLQKYNNEIITQNTQFGWIISGIYPQEYHKTMKVTSLMTRTEEVKQLTKFWELEEVAQKNEIFNQAEQICERYYKDTTRRNKNGSYTVRIPIKNRSLNLGESRPTAAARLIQLERKLYKNEDLKLQYHDFMSEYLEMGHMRKVKNSNYHKARYYIPHQPVVREDSLSTKMRVVFDASSQTSAKMSLNDNMHKGPRLQQDLSTILLRWRKHKVAFMADIEKMYRFIKVHEDDLTYQRILWRFSPDKPIDEYELLTVTYGTAAAPYLAVKTLQRLAQDEKSKYPLASKVTLQDVYVDDILSEESTIESAKNLQNQLINMLHAGGFNLRKWSSNAPELLNNIAQYNEDSLLKLPQDETRKSLGVRWSPSEDYFQFQITIKEKENPTKRFILSEILKLFDPLGWLAPIIIKMKLLIQELWTNGMNWDEPVDENIKNRWHEFQTQLINIEKIKIPRWIHYNDTSGIDLHGYCDASECAYGAVVYSRIKIKDQFHVTLLQARSKVAPRKNKTTLPRLELCAALLLSKLMKKVEETLDCKIDNIYCWSDSMITIGWIKGEASRWKPFIANRVTEIQNHVSKENWNYVKSGENPADLITRGIEPNKLQHFQLWWEGPSLLKNNHIPITKSVPQCSEDIKVCHQVSVQIKNNIWNRVSNYTNMIRTLVHCYRWVDKIQKGSPLSLQEIHATTTKVNRNIQQEYFHEEYKALKAKLHGKRSSQLSSLVPFLDDNDFMHVGGRLENSRPLCALSDDINNDVIFTSTQFLIGRKSVGIPNPISTTMMNNLERWRFVQKIKKDSRSSWSKDYLHQLQSRYVWKNNQENLQNGTVVIMKEEIITPSKWPIAKIIEIHSGADGATRVVTLKKASGSSLKRSINTLIPLPIHENESKPETKTISSNCTRLTSQLGQSNTNYKSHRKGITKMLFLTLMILFQLPVSMANYTQKAVSEGIYVEHIGTATIDRGIFRIQTNFEKQKIENALSKIEEINAQFKKFCDDSKYNNVRIQCDQLYDHLQEEKDKFRLIKEYLSEVSISRKKRGLLGSMLTSVFGVNDEVYRDIEALQSNQHNLIQASNQQTKFMISTVSTLNETESRIEAKLARFQTKLNQAIRYMNTVNVWYRTIDNNEVNIHTLQMFQIANNYITETMECYTGIIDIFLNRGSIYSMLSPSKIKEIIRAANKKLPSNLKIMQNPVLYTKIEENSTHVQVYGYFPIQDIANYTLIHVTPIPKKLSGCEYGILEVQHAIIGIDYNNEYYFELTQEELTTCISGKSNSYLCYPKTVKHMPSNGNCVVDQIFKLHEKFQCSTKTVTISSVIWKQLYMPNTWLFISNKPLRTSIICDGERQEVLLQNIGVINIAENCIIKTEQNVLVSKRLTTVPVIATYNKQLNFSFFNNNTRNPEISMFKTETVLDSSKDLFQHLINDQTALQTQLHSTIWEQIESHSYVASAVSVGVSITIILLIYCFGPQVKRCTQRAASRLRARAAPPPPPPSPPPPPGRHRQPLYSSVRPAADRPTRVRRCNEIIELKPLESLPTSREGQDVQPYDC